MLHLLKRQVEARVKFAPVKLLKQGPVEDAQRRHLRELLLLFLRVTALLLLALAFARPFFQSTSASQSSGVTVVALDTSLSMSAPGQFDRAKQLAKAAIGRAQAGDLIGVVTFADSARVAAAPSGDRALTLSAIDSATTGFGATHYRAALNAASEMITAAGGRRATIVVVTDLQESGWDSGDRATLPESARVELADIGAPPPNLAVTGVRIDGDHAVATVRNTAAQAREARARLSVDGRAVSEATAAIGPNQSGEVTLAGARGFTASVSVDDREGVQGDNVRFVVLNNAGRPSVLIVTTNGDLARESFYLQQALLAAGSDGAAYQVEGVGGAQLAGWDNARFERRAAVVLLSTVGLERHGRDELAAYVRTGGGVLAAASQDVNGEVLAEILGGPSTLTLTPVPDRNGQPQTRTLAPADARHPVFQAFGVRAGTLALVKFQRITTIAAEGCQTLARFTSGEPALVECAPGEGRALVLASDLDNRGNDFPLHATFVPFLHEAVRYLAGGRPRGGEYLVGEAPAGVPSKPGLANISDLAGGATRTIAVNVNPEESDPGRLSVDEFQAAVTRLKDVSRSEGRLEAQQQEDRQHIWQYVLALMAAMLIMESLVAKRTA